MDKQNILESAAYEALFPPNSYESTFEKIATHLKEGNSCQLVALPGTGRSTMFGILTHNNKVKQKLFGDSYTTYHFVPIDISEVRNKPYSDVLRLILFSVEDSLKKRGLTISTQRNPIPQHDELAIFQALKGLVDTALENHLYLVLLFDRFEEYTSSLSPSLFSNLRILQNRAKFRFSVIISTTRPLEQILDEEFYNDFYELLQGHTTFVPLTDAPSLEFRFSYLEKTTGKQLPQETKETILTLSGRHGKTARICAEEVIEHDHYENLKDFFLTSKAVRSIFYEIWNTLTPQEKHVLKELVQGNNPPESKHLIDIGVLIKNSISIPLFEAFIKQRIAQKEDDVFLYKPETTQILKGDDDLSDTLTKTEFLLLRFFIENKDRTVNREEIIQTVWQDSKTTAGVTDQALDQLMFRLRRKIEDDPNNPVHLQTIKGRGFRFES